MRGATESKGKIRKKMGFEEVLPGFVYNIVLLDTAIFGGRGSRQVGHSSLSNSVIQYLSSCLDCQLCEDSNTFHFVPYCIPQLTQ